VGRPSAAATARSGPPATSRARRACSARPGRHGGLPPRELTEAATTRLERSAATTSAERRLPARKRTEGCRHESRKTRAANDNCSATDTLMTQRTRAVRRTAPFNRRHAVCSIRTRSMHSSAQTCSRAGAGRRAGSGHGASRVGACARDRGRPVQRVGGGAVPFRALSADHGPPPARGADPVCSSPPSAIPTAATASSGLPRTAPHTRCSAPLGRYRRRPTPAAWRC
jgi:hypothetical protein